MTSLAMGVIHSLSRKVSCTIFCGILWYSETLPTNVQQCPKISLDQQSMTNDELFTFLVITR